MTRADLLKLALIPPAALTIAAVGFVAAVERAYRKAPKLPEGVRVYGSVATTSPDWRDVDAADMQAWAETSLPLGVESRAAMSSTKEGA